MEYWDLYDKDRKPLGRTHKKGNYRFFRVKHSLKDLPPIDFDYDTISIDCQTKELAEMINASYFHENISVTEQDILGWKTHKTFREDLCVYINADGGIMAASGIAEYDEKCKEGVLEWVQVLPEYREQGYGTKIVTVLLHKLKKAGAEFVTVSGNLDNETSLLNCTENAHSRVMMYGILRGNK